jgi:hypothetical protein
MNARPAAIYHLWLLALGFSVWCSALVIVYVLHAIGCSLHWSNGALRLGLSLTVVVALALVGWRLRPDWRVPPMGNRVDPNCGLRHHRFHPRPDAAADHMHLRTRATIEALGDRG